jgi:DNA-binding beta-propeller fold protein YncE
MVVDNGSLPSLAAIGVNTATNRVYVSNPDNTPEPTVTVIDGSTNQIIDNIGGFGSDLPGSIAVDSVHNRIYVQTNEERIDVIDGASNEIVQSSQSHLYTGALALNPSSSLIYASSTANGGNAIAVVDGQDLSQLATIDVNVSPPGSIALDPNTAQLFTAGYPGQMDVIHTNNNELWNTVSNANGPLAVDDVNHLIWGVGSIPLQGYPQVITIWHEVGVSAK